MLAEQPGPVEDRVVDDREGRQRQDADHRADLDRHDRSRPAAAAGRSRSRPPRPRAPCSSIASAMREKCSRNLTMRSVAGLGRPVEQRRDRRHREGVRRHPPRRVGLLEHVAVREVRPVDRADVVEAEEAALEHVRAVGVEPVHPPGEVDEQLVEDAAQKCHVGAAVDHEHLQCSPRLHRRVDVVEGPLVRGERAVRMLEPLAAEERQLVLRECRVDVGERDAVKRHVPRGEPRVLPRIGHRHDVERLEVDPVACSCRRGATPGAGAGSGRRASQRLTS